MRAGIALILIFCLAGCGKKTAVKEYSVPETQVADGGIAASNGSYEFYGRGKVIKSV